MLIPLLTLVFRKGFKLQLSCVLLIFPLERPELLFREIEPTSVFQNWQVEIVYIYICDLQHVLIYESDVEMVKLSYLAHVSSHAFYKSLLSSCQVCNLFLLIVVTVVYVRIPELLQLNHQPLANIS